MKKIIFSFIAMLLLSGFMLHGQPETITIGNGTGSTYGPISSFYGYERCLMLYRSDELPATGEILSIALQNPSTTRTDIPLLIYFMEVAWDNIPATSTLIWNELIADATLVYQGMPNITAGPGWYTISTTTLNSFIYSGTENLLVLTATDKGGSGNSSQYWAYGLEGTSTNVIYTTYKRDQGSIGPPNDNISFAANQAIGGTMTQGNGTESDFFKPNVRWNTQFVIDPVDASCTRPSNFAVSNITYNSANTTWIPGSTETQWLFSYKQTSATNWGAEILVTNVPGFPMTNLNSNTSYDARVRTFCAVGDTSLFRTLSFRTACGDITTLPWSENFDTYGANTFPPCMFRPEVYLSHPQIVTAQSASSPNSMRFQSNTETMVVTPRFEQDVRGLMVSFKLRRENLNSGTFQVGIVTDPSNINSFVAVQTFDQTIYNVWDEYEVAIAPTGLPVAHYIGFRHMAYTNSAAYWLDDIEVSITPSCLRPTQIEVLQLGTSANASWNQVGATSQWLLSYKPSSDLAWGDEIILTEPSYILTPLTEVTSYDLRVRAICTAGDTTNYRLTTFRTGLVPAPLPFVEDFETPSAWQLINSTASVNKWVISTNITANNNGGTRCLYITNNENATPPPYEYTISSQTAHVYAVKHLLFDEVGQYTIAYDWKNQGESASWDYIQVWLAPASAEIIAGSTPTTLGSAGWINLYGTVNLSLQSTWQNKVEEFFITQTGTYQLLFYWFNDGSSGTQPPGAIDNIEVRRNTCPRPAAVAVQDIEVDGATITWTSSGDENQWLLSYRALATNWISEILVTGTPEYLLTGLAASTAYDVRVRTICAGGDTSAFTTTTFRTACSFITAPFFDSFESYPTGNVPIPCYTKGTDYSTTTIYPQVSSVWAATGTRSLYFYGYNTTYEYIATSPVDTLLHPINTLQVSFKLRTTATAAAASGVQVGVMTDPNNYSTFVPVGAWQKSSTTTAFEDKHVSLASYTGTGVYIAIRCVGPGGSTYNYNYLDDLTIDFIPTCLPPTNIAVSDITTSSVEISWTPMDNHTGYTVYYRPIGATDYIPVPATGSSITLENLPASTCFNFYMVPICEEDDISGSSQTMSFCTACDIITQFPWFEGFEGNWILATGGAGNIPAPNCWTAIDKGGTNGNYIYNWHRNDQPNNTSGSTSPGTSYSGNHHAICYTDYGTSDHNDWLITPQLQLTGNERLRFWAMRATTATSEPDEISVYISDENITLDATEMGTYDVLPGFTRIFRQNPLPTGNWARYEVNLNQYSGNRYIAFVREGTPDGYILRLDDVLVEPLPTCVPPHSISISSLAPNDVHIDFSPGQLTDDAWRLYYKTSTASAWDSVDVYNSPAQITGLTPNTPYQYYFKTNCGTELSEATNTSTFTTPCGYITIPFFESFESYPTGNVPIPCYTRGTDYSTTTIYPQVSSVYAATGTRSLYFYGWNTTYEYIATSPIDISVHPINTLQVSFKLRTTATAAAASGLQVGVMTDPNDYSTFVPVGVWQKSATTTVFEEKEVPLSSYTGTGRYIAIRSIGPGGSAYNYNYLDDLTIDFIPACSRPASIDIIPQGNRAIANWMQVGSETQWEISYKLATAPNWNGAATEIVDAPTYLITPLTLNTSYNVRVRAVCDDDEYSDYRMVTFNSGGLPDCDPVIDLTATVSDNDIILTWAAQAGDPLSYEISYNGVIQDTVYAPVTTYTFTNLAEGYHSFSIKTFFADNYCIPTSVFVGAAIGNFCVDLTIGTGTTNVRTIPVETWYNHSYTQQIFDAADLMQGMAINSIAFNYTHATSIIKNPVTIYLGHTTKSQFGSTATNEWIPVSELEQVFTGSVMFNSSQTWLTIEFDEPFIYADGNLVLAVLNNHGSYAPMTSTDLPFLAHSTGSLYKTLRYQVDGTTPINVNGPTPPSVTDRLMIRNNVRFNVCTLPEIDMAATRITGEMQPGINTPYTYTVTVRNFGSGETPANNYTVKVMTGDEVLGEVLVTEPLLQLQTNVVAVPDIVFTEDMIGSLCLKGLVEIAGDENENNNMTSCLTVAVQPDIDMAAISISGPVRTPALSPRTYNVTVRNNGFIADAVDNYTVKIMTEGGTQLGSVVVTEPLAQYNNITVPVTIEFPEAGIVNIRGVVELAGDQMASNNMTPLHTVTVLAAGSEIIYVPSTISENPWTGTTATTMPFNWYFNNSMVQSVYLGSEIGVEGGLITHLTWFYNNTSEVVYTRPAKVYLATTTQTSLASAWLPLSAFTLVYEGELTNPLGMYALSVELSTPFIYTGGNLVVMTERPFMSPYQSSINGYTFTPATTSRSRTYNTDTESSAFNWTQPGSTSNMVSNIEIIMDTTPLVQYTVSGLVKNLAGDPISGAQITLSGFNNPPSVTSNSTGAFTMDNVYAFDRYALTVTATGYVTYTDTIDVSANIDLGVIVLHDVTVPPASVTATIVDIDVEVTWTPGSTSGGIVGYHVWRFRSSQEPIEDNWTQLTATTSPVSGNTFTDNTWRTLPAETYKYAVKTVYHGGILSDPAISNAVERVTSGPYTINVTTNSGVSAANAKVRLTGGGSTNPSGTVGANGSVTFNDLLFGTYRVDITHIGFHDYTTNVTITQGSPAHNAVLVEVLEPPHQLKLVQPNCETATLTWSMFAPFYDDMESYQNFIINNIGNYTLIETAGNLPPRTPSGVSWLNSSQPQSFIVMNPSATTPASTAASWAPHSGSKYLACFNKDIGNPYEGGTNNDWLILPKLRIISGTVFKFWTKSYDQSRLDRFKVGVSTTGTDPDDFNFISAGNYEVAPATWTVKEYNLSAYAGQEVRLAINCVSYDSWFLMIDDISVDVPGKSNFNEPSHYSVYLNGTVHAQNILDTRFVFNKNNTPFGNYSRVGVQAHYTTGVSDIVTLNQPFEICNSIANYEVNYGIYPNPATNSLTVDRSTSTPAVIELYNAIGMRISQYETSDMKYDISVASLSSGTYFIRVIEGDRTGVKSFVKK